MQFDSKTRVFFFREVLMPVSYNVLRNNATQYHLRVILPSLYGSRYRLGGRQAFGERLCSCRPMSYGDHVSSYSRASSVSVHLAYRTLST